MLFDSCCLRSASRPNDFEKAQLRMSCYVWALTGVKHRVSDRPFSLLSHSTAWVSGGMEIGVRVLLRCVGSSQTAG